jgi:hypothetical protein
MVVMNEFMASKRHNGAWIVCEQMDIHLGGETILKFSKKKAIFFNSNWQLILD